MEEGLQDLEVGTRSPGTGRGAGPAGGQYAGGWAAVQAAQGLQAWRSAEQFGQGGREHRSREHRGRTPWQATVAGALRHGWTGHDVQGQDVVGGHIKDIPFKRNLTCNLKETQDQAQDRHVGR